MHPVANQQSLHSFRRTDVSLAANGSSFDIKTHVSLQHGLLPKHLREPRRACAQEEPRRSRCDVLTRGFVACHGPQQIGNASVPLSGSSERFNSRCLAADDASPWFLKRLLAAGDSWHSVQIPPSDVARVVPTQNVTDTPTRPLLRIQLPDSAARTPRSNHFVLARIIQPNTLLW